MFGINKEEKKLKKELKLEKTLTSISGLTRRIRRKSQRKM